MEHPRIQGNQPAAHPAPLQLPGIYPELVYPDERVTVVEDSQLHRSIGLL
jgi:hypothetical protein